MKHLAAYLLLQLGGNASPSAKDITAVLESVGIEADSDRLKTLLAELKGKDVNEVRAHRVLSVSTTANANMRVDSSSLRAPLSSPPSPRAVVVVLPPPVLPLAAPPPRPPRRRPRRRVRIAHTPVISETDILTFSHREGGVRRRHGIRSLRLSALHLKQSKANRDGDHRGRGLVTSGRNGENTGISITLWKRGVRDVKILVDQGRLRYKKPQQKTLFGSQSRSSPEVTASALDA